MKKILYSIIALAGLTYMASCSSGEYLANPTAVVNTSSNPFTPLEYDAFNWGGTDPLSCSINGVPFVGDSATTTFGLDTSGSNVIMSVKDGVKGMTLVLGEAYGGNVYPMFYKQYTRYAIFRDSLFDPYQYYSYWGNVGQIQIVRNDSARIIGRFYFQACNGMDSGTLVNVTNGWFNVGKRP